MDFRHMILYQANPVKIVVKPWLGRHHVYALFILPRKYLADVRNFQVWVRVKGSNQPVKAWVAPPNLPDNLEIPDGHFVAVAYFWTRKTLWQILQGKYGELQQTCSWTIYIK